MTNQALPGYAASAAICATSAGSYNTVMTIKEVDAELDGKNTDITVLSMVTIKRLQTAQDAKYTLTGFFDPTDSTGQQELYTLLITPATPGSEYYIKVLYAGASGSEIIGWKQQFLPSQIQNKAVAEATADVVFTLEGSGPVTLVTS